MMKVATKCLSLTLIMQTLFPMGTCTGMFNPAKNKRTYQSSTFESPRGSSSKAIDTEKGTSYENGQCTHTANTEQTWWAIDLEKVYTVYNVTVTNRHYQPSRLRNFTIMGSNESFNLTEASDLQVCAHKSDPVDVGGTEHLECKPPLHKRYIIVTKTATVVNLQALSLCNFEVSAACLSGRYGENCGNKCSSRCRSDIPCDIFNGSCKNCKAGYTGDRCQSDCSPGTYGDRCKYNCSPNCFTSCKSSSDTGSCVDGKCKIGYLYGGSCSTVCGSGTFGANCSQDCHCAGDTCEHIKGVCAGDCAPGWEGDTCSIRNGKSTSNATTMVPAIAGGVAAAALLLLVLLIVIIVILLRRRRPGAMKHSQTLISETQNGIGHSNNGLNEQIAVHNEIIPKKKEKPLKAVKPVIVTRSEPVTEPILEQSEDESDVLSEGPTYSNFEGSETLIQVSEFGTYLSNRKNVEHPFKHEYQNLPNAVYPWDQANTKELIGKNRYKNIFPYDNNRVMLEQLGDDQTSTYVNASFVKDYKGEVAYIAALGATHATVPDFWRMIWEHNVQLIVMVTNLVELMKIKCEQYWPSEGVAHYGDITVSLDKQVVKHTYTHRTFSVTHGSDSKVVEHYQYTAWPDKSVPSHLPTLYKIRGLMKSHREQRKTPILVHCSAGVGRTGTVIALDILLDQAAAESRVDVCQCVELLRTQRTNMVQTLVQYVFIHDALYELLSVGSTVIPCDRVQSLLTTDEGKRTLDKQFMMLRSIAPNFSDNDMVLGKKENKDKNRDMSIIPCDNLRVKLQTAPETYINAVYVEGYRNSHYIATQIPLPTTAGVFWKMVYELKSTTLVCLQSDPKYTQWFSSEKSEVDFDQLTVRTNSIDNDDIITKYDITVEKAGAAEYANVGGSTNNINDEASLQVQLVVVNEWSDKPLNDRDLAMLVKSVNGISNQPEGAKLTTVICRNGSNECGLYIATCWLLKMAEIEKEVDVFHVVKQIRKTRPQLILNMEQYTVLHKMVQQYIEMRDGHK